MTIVFMTIVNTVMMFGVKFELRNKVSTKNRINA